MSKVFKLFFIFLLFFINSQILFASNQEIKIISRKEWKADESYRYLDSKIWQEKIASWKNTPKKELSEFQKKIAILKAQKVKKANNFLLKNFKDNIGIKKIIRQENGHKLVWPLAYSNKKTSIIIHHTDTDLKKGDDIYEIVRKIYKFHAIKRGWGDIGYNYLIGPNGEIFEGRAGGDYVVGAHDKWNNQSSIGISLIGNFKHKKIPEKQLKSLEKLIKYLIKKYNININKKQAFFKWNYGINKKALNNPLKVIYKYPIIGHRDAGTTACPGEEGYKQLQELKKKLGVGQNDKTNFLIQNIKEKLKKLNEHKLLSILAKIEILLDKDYNNPILHELKDTILNIENTKNNKIYKNTKKESFDKTNKIKVKLSYPLKDYISFKISKKLKAKLEKTKNEIILNFIKNWKYRKNDIVLNFIYKNNKLFSNNKEIIDFDKVKFLRIKVPKDEIIEISSWDRKPKWDKTGKLNDNKFRGDIILYSKNNQLIVVNELYLEDYLKGLGEVSNNTNLEKIKTIIILARTYARWYITKAKKFAGEWFDASDNPNIFQKYLGFGLEQRSPNINKIVEETRDLVITYDGNLIKPWYFSQSNGKTTSFIDYCKNTSGIPDCAYPEKFPFLIGVEDPGGVGKQKLGHGVGVPGSGIQYFAERGWNFQMIIKYFLKGVEIEKK